MMVEFQWATYPRLQEKSFFESTLLIYIEENKIHTPIQDSMHWTRRFEYPWVLEMMSSDGNVLDVGAGATALQFLLAKDHTVMSADIDQNAINWVNSKPEQCGSRNYFVERRNLESVYASLPTLPFKNGEFKTVICISVLEHLPKDQVMPSIRELIRVSNKEIFVTMDIALTTNTRQTDMDDLKKITQELGFECPPLDRLALTFRIGQEFAVACMRLYP